MKSKKIRLFAALFCALLLVGLCVFPLLWNKDSDFAGTDAQAGELIMKIAPDYQPWTESWWSPPGSETESLLFCLQAALGAGVFCFCAGYLLAAKKYRRLALQETRPNDPA